MSRNSETIFSNIRRISEISDQLSRHLVSKEELKFLEGDLGAIADTDHKTADLYDRLITHDINNQVDRIVETALKKEISSGVEKKIKDDIDSLFLKYALSDENRQYIDMALQVLDGVRKKKSYQLDIFSIYEINFKNWQEEGLPETLYSIAKLFYEKKRDKAAAKLSQNLSKDQQAYLGQKKAAVQGRMPYGKEKRQLAWAKALISMADEVALGKKIVRLPSDDEVRMIFKDLDYIKSEI